METIQFEHQHVEQFRQWVAEAKNIVVVSHTNPDGDAVGSSLGTRHVIKAATGITPMVVLPSRCPDTFHYLADSDTIVDADTNLQRCIQLLSDADLIIGIDFNAISRVDRLCDTLIASTARKVLIDHHRGPDYDHFALVFSDDEASSACEVAYWLYTATWGEQCIDYHAARCLYNGICTDTGSFSYSCDHPSLYHATAALVARDIDVADIHNQINNDFTAERLLFWGFAISERLRIFPQQRFAYFYLSMQDMQRFGVTAADLNGLVNYTIMMKDIEVGALVREEIGRTKVSLRSKNHIDVNSIARDHFGGGGHLQASGATVIDTLENTIARLEEVMQVSTNPNNTPTR